MGIVFPHFYNIASARHYKTDPHDILFTSQNNKQNSSPSLLWNYMIIDAMKKKVQTVIVNNSTNINKTNNHLSPQIIENNKKKNHHYILLW
jgi:hypothetical protein